jgi:hypothetical protein
MEGEEEDKENAVNSEIRYIALELMKIAARGGKEFKAVAGEYLDNAELLKRMIAGEEKSAPQHARKMAGKEK